MLETLRIWPKIRERIITGPLGPYCDDYLSWLEKAGYSRLGIRRHMQAMDRLGCWLRSRRLSVADIDEQVIEHFVCSFHRIRSPRYISGRAPEIVGAVHRLAQFLWQRGVANPHSSNAPTTPASRWLMSYEKYLRQVHGLSAGTRTIYLRYARRFIGTLGGEGELDWSTLKAETVTEFVRTEAGRLKPCACRGPVTATRAMLRFLLTSGVILPGLLGAVPTVRQWKLATLPRYLSEEQLACVLDQSKSDNPNGLRDHAVVLLMARLGLRAGEVAHLTLDDLDWAGGSVRIGPGKSATTRQLPISQELAEALLAYLRARGSIPNVRWVFLCARPPRHRPLRTAAVTCIAKRVLHRAGVSIDRPGAHVFRHTAATQMLRRGVPFKQIADTLGHRLLETTTIYAKLDIARLAALALPWPGAKP